MSTIPRTNPLEILLVEDKPVGVTVIQEAFKEARIADRVAVIHDGQEAMGHLGAPGRDRDAARPDLISLDFNLPSCCPTPEYYGITRYA